MDQPQSTPLEAVLARDLAVAENRYRELARAAETALQDERTRAQLYLDVSGAVIVVLDGSNQMTLVNRAGVELIGQEESVLLGNSGGGREEHSGQYRDQTRGTPKKDGLDGVRRQVAVSPSQLVRVGPTHPNGPGPTLSHRCRHC